MKKDILLLAVSSKGRNNYCVAGIDINSNSYIRLVSDDSTIDFAIHKEDFVYGKYQRVPRKLHIIRADVGEKLPKNGAQTENYLSLIKKNIEHVSKVIDANDLMFPLISELPYGDFDNVVTEQTYSQLNHSIEVVKAYNIRFKEVINFKGEKRIRIEFYLQSNVAPGLCRDYRLTDPQYMYNPNVVGTVIEKAYLVITVGPENNSDYFRRYKFVAGVIEY